MRRKTIFILLINLFFLPVNYAQSTRSLVNDGVDLYKKGKITDAEVNFKKGVEKSPKNLQANFNLGDAYYKNKRYEEAITAYQKTLQVSRDKNFISKVYHNIGNSFLKQKKLKESIEAYKNALKLNSNDLQTKYNLSYALQQMKKDKNKKDKNKNDKNKKDKNKKDKNKKDKNKNDPNKNKDKDKNKDKQDKQNKKNKPKQNPSQKKKNKISKEQAKQILKALMNNEKKLQKKLRRRKAKVVKTEKDW